MIKPDDSSLLPHQRNAVEERARGLLNRSDSWGRFPTPVEDVLEAAKLRVAPVSLFDPHRIMEYLQSRSQRAKATVKSAISKILGIYDADEELIHIDHSVGVSKQKFLQLHETGHHQLPWHKRVFRIFQDCEATLSPDTAELFEREANNFARYVLFQGDIFRRLAADFEMGIKTPMKLAKKFGASVYASCREFARTNHRPCLVYVLEPIEHPSTGGMRAAVRRIEASPSFESQFGKPIDDVITIDHPISSVLPIGRKMTRPTPLAVKDLNGEIHECLMEAFDTTFNVLVLIYPIRALTSATFVLPAA